MTQQLATLDGSTPLMAWEPANEYAALVAELEGDHNPQGATERHLVEELALIIWRRKRLKAAEQVEILKTLPRNTDYDRGRDFVKEQSERFVSSSKDLDPTEFLGWSDKELDLERQKLASEVNALEKVLGILAGGKKSDYTKALKALPGDWADWSYEAEDWKGDIEELSEHLKDYIALDVPRRQSLLQHARMINSLSTAYSYASANMVGLMKLDMALSKKMSETLAMLARLQEIREAA